MDNAYRSLINAFIEECMPMAEKLADLFFNFERRWKFGDPADELFQPIKSDLHTIKGNSAMMGFTPIERTAHALEDVCALLIKRPELRDEQAAELLMEGGDLLVRMLQQAESENVQAGPAEEYILKLQDYVETARERRSGTDRRSDQEWRSGDDRRQGKERRQEPAAKGQQPAIGKVSDTIRVDFKRLDELLEAVGEGVIVQSVLSEVHQRMSLAFRDSAEVDMLGRAILSLDKIMKRLEDTLMDTRLLPISTLFGRFPRLVRDLSRQKGTPATLVTLGEETRIDKRIIDRLGEPLLHLIRNAFSHGIEDQEERKKRDKKAEAKITLQAKNLSDRVVISVGDDGGGIDVEKVRQKAQSMGLETTNLSAEEVKRLIFLPGFSTSAEVSELSGRGVGMDVVAETIQSLGGSIEVHSEIKCGTEFEINLPLTLTVIRSLLIEVDKELYAIPLSHVVESVKLEEMRIHEIKDFGMLNWRGKMLHVVDGGNLLDTESKSKKRTFCVIVSSGSRSKAILADRLVSHQDIVVKGLDSIFADSYTIFGATILGNGQVVFILDVARIIDESVAEKKTFTSPPVTPLQ